ncbi:Ribosome-recycling factor [Smittium culicis]|uniref:Ribosome-recycling factor n=1 Tax=Smittium culicis TaxID=133412 RepID=A0A1R1X612_9FUNG|nr:Ribosome-recycling factor [Smittium culicis]OMJ20528.1 Ribosome-recycling factor [Smittium culicis]
MSSNCQKTILAIIRATKPAFPSGNLSSKYIFNRFNGPSICPTSFRSYSKKVKEAKQKIKDLKSEIKTDNEGNLELVDLEKFREKMDKVIHFLSNELLSIRSGRANPGLISSLPFKSKAEKAKRLDQVATISAKDAQTLIVVPFEEDSLSNIEKAIRNSGLGLNPLTEGSAIKVPIPRQTNEDRQKIIKALNQLTESTKVQIRKHRQDINKQLKSKEKAVSKDYYKQWEKDIDEVASEYIEKIDSSIKLKIKEIEKN